MRVPLTSLSVALCLLAATACGGGAPPRATAIDTECVQGQPFATRVTEIEQRDEAQLASLSRNLAEARTTADDQAVLRQVSTLLAQEEADLRAAPVPKEDADVVAALIAADESMRDQADAMSTLPAEGMAARQADLDQAARARAQAARALALRAEFVSGECGA